MGATPCRFYLQGWCSQKEKCWFRHEGLVMGSNAPKDGPVPSQFKGIPCTLFQLGACTKGNLCENAHILEDGSTANPPPMAPALQDHILALGGVPSQLAGTTGTF